MEQVFRFKRFSVRQDGVAMRVGTDAVVLGVLAQVEGAGRILDVGTGTGVIALMLAQRAVDARVMGIDIDEVAVMRAAENFGRSPFAGRLEARRADFRQTGAEGTGEVDLVVCNPPFFKTAPQGMNRERRVARVAETLTFGELATGAWRVLKGGGWLWVIVPQERADELWMVAWERGFGLGRWIDIQTKAGKAVQRVVVGLRKDVTAAGSGEVAREQLVLMDKRGEKTEEWAALTADFYL